MGNTHAAFVLVKVTNTYLISIPSKLPDVLQELVGAHVGGI